MTELELRDGVHAALKDKGLYWCCWCPRKMRGHAVYQHLNHVHPDKVALVIAEGTPMPPLQEFVKPPRPPKKEKDIPGQILMFTDDGPKREFD